MFYLFHLLEMSLPEPSDLHLSEQADCCTWHSVAMLSLLATILKMLPISVLYGICCFLCLPVFYIIQAFNWRNKNHNSNFK